MSARTGSAGAASAQRQPGGELRALSTLAFGDLAGFVGAIRDMHVGIARRAFVGVGPGARPVQALHDSVCEEAYGTVAAGAHAAGRAAGELLSRSGLDERTQLSRSRRGSELIGVLDGLIGDQLARCGSALTGPPTLRVEGEPVEIDRRSLARAFPRASGRLVVFLHGLMETEHAWLWGAQAQQDTYGGRLERALGYTPLYVRYNSGLHISENGRALARLLERALERWPLEPRQIALVGHSMGGLVARSACHYACEQELRWCERVTHVISLGTPHLGAPLAQGAHVAAAALDALPETRMLGALLRRRSAGIRDLREGSLVDEDWRGSDPDALRARACREVPLLAGATHCFVSASITRSASHPLGRVLGDTLVLVPSASGRGRSRRIPFDARHGRHVGSAHHFALLNHPEVYRQLHGWLAAGAPSQRTGTAAPVNI